MKPTELLKRLMNDANDNPNSLAAKLKQRTRQPQIYRFLEGIAREPRRSTLQPVADHYGVPVDAFYDEAAADRAYQRISLLSKGSQTPTQVIESQHNDDSQVQSIGVSVPLLSSVEAADIHHFFEVYDAEAPGRTHIDTAVPVQRHTFSWRVEGDQMEPDFKHGMYLIIEPDLTPAPGDYVLAKNSSKEVTFKQLQSDGGDWYLKPLNNRYPIKPLGDYVIVGVVRAAELRFR